jgi:hypothetical protein
VVRASHTFSELSQIPVLVADIAGTGPVSGRPFRLGVTERRRTLSDQFVASGTVDLRCSWACFDDPHLAAAVGYPLGLPPAQIAKLLGPRPASDLSFRFAVELPGHVTASDVASRTPGGQIVWSPALGSSMPLSASTDLVNVALLRHLAAAVSAGALIVLCTAAYLLVRRRRRRRWRFSERRSRRDWRSPSARSWR